MKRQGTFSNRPFIRWRIFSRLVAFLLVALTPIVALAFPQPPNLVAGSVTINGAAAPDGAELVVKLKVLSAGNRAELKVFATTKVAGGQYGFKPLLSVPSDDPETPEKEGAAPDELLYFFLATPQGDLGVPGDPPRF